MKFFATALVAAAFEAQLALGVELGQSCVTAPLSKVFKRINLLRANAVDDTVTKPNYTTVVGVGTKFTDNKWTMIQNGILTPLAIGNTWDVTVLSGKARITTGVALIGKVAPTVKVPMVWSEGLALGNATYLNEWAAAYGKSGAFTGLSTPNGTTTASRAKENGSAGGPLVEAAYFFDAYSLDATDLMNFLITNDGDGNEMAAALFDSAALTYKAVSIGIKKADSCTVDISTAASPVGCQHAMIVTATTAYTNGSSAAACQPVINYGGGVCDPDLWGGSVWESMQDARLFRKPTWTTLLDSMKAKVDGMQVTWDWVGSGTETVATIVNTLGVSQTETKALSNEAIACDTVPWKWYPAMFLAAKDQTTYMATAADVSSTHGDSSLASRGAKYGAPGAEFVEGIYKGTNSAAMTVARLLIDGTTASAPFRTSFWTAANDQAGVSCATHTDKERVCTALVGSGFVASDAYAACTVAAVAATAVTPAGAASLAGAMLVASASALALLQ